MRGRAEGDQAGEVLVLGSKAVEHPRAHRGPGKLEDPRVQLEKRLGMVREVGLHAIDDAEGVGMLGDLGKQVRDPEAALAVLLEFPGRSEQLGGGGLSLADRFAGVARELRLVVEGIDVRRATFHAEEDDPPGRGGKCGALGASGPADRSDAQVESPAKAR